MFRSMLPQGDLWFAYEHGGVQMDASTEGLVAAHEHPGTTFQMDAKARDLLRNLNDVLCSIWMFQQTDLLHTDRTRILCYVYVMFAMDA